MIAVEVVCVQPLFTLGNLDLTLHISMCSNLSDALNSAATMSELFFHGKHEFCFCFICSSYCNDFFCDEAACKVVVASHYLRQSSFYTVGVAVTEVARGDDLVARARPPSFAADIT